MSSTGDFILGGLLSGAGQAITKNADQARIDALEALKREYAVEDRNFNADQEMARTKQAGANALATVQATGAENRSTEKVKLDGDAYLAQLKGIIDLNNDKVLEALRHSHKVSEAELQSALDTQRELTEAGVEIGHEQVTTDGKIVFFNKKGDPLRYSAHPGSFVPTGAGSSDNGQSVSDLLGDTPPSGAKAKGSSPAKAPTANTGKGMPPGWDGKKELQFEQLYTQATPQNAPRLFRDGHKIPADEARLMIAGAL